jgi:threonine dehydratase
LSVCDAPYAQQALSPAKALDAIRVAAAIKAILVILIMMLAETRLACNAFNFSCRLDLREIAGAVAVGVSPANREIAAGKAASTIRAKMSTTPEAVRPIQLSEIREARNRIAKTIVRTPLIRLEPGPDQPDIRLKLENLQPINAYKLRGAANAVAMLPESERERGVWTISAGNAGQGVAYAAKQAGVPCSVVVIETAPQSKVERMRALGAKLIPAPYDVAWKALEERSFPGAEGTFIHPFDDHNFIAGHATMGLEILEDAPETTAVIASIGGGGLITGVASAIKALKPEVKVFGVEPETAAPAALSFEKGSPQVFKHWRASFVDGAGGQSMFPRMWERMKPVVDDYIVVSLDETKRAMRLMAEKARVISEGAGALPVAAALTGKAGEGPIVAIVSGGNIDLDKFCDLIAS